MINQTDLIHDVLSFSDNFTIMTTNNEALEPECKHNVLEFQWFACDDQGQGERPVAELIASYGASHWVGFRSEASH
jgi:hypothetical protein